MERFTGTSYESAIELAKNKLKNGFKIINKREINLSNSGLSNESLFEIIVSQDKNVPELTKMEKLTDIDYSIFLSLIKKELKPLNELKTDILLFRQEIDLLSKKIKNFIHPELETNEFPVYDLLCEIGFEKPLALKFTREISLSKNSSNNKEGLNIAFNKSFKHLFHTLSIQDNDAIVFFGQSKSGKSKVTELIADKLLKYHSINIIKELNLEKKVNNGITIIDSPSIRLNEMGVMKNLSKLTDSYQKIYRVLVVSATTGFEDMLHLVASFAPIKPSFIIFTKFDETTQPGKLISLLYETGLKAFGLTSFNDTIEYTEDCQSLFVSTIEKNLGMYN